MIETSLTTPSPAGRSGLFRQSHFRTSNSKMPRTPFSIAPTMRRKLSSVLVATGIFACLGAVTTAAVGRPVEIGTMNAVLIGTGIGLFEEFYVQSPRGNWIRAMHPLRAISIYVVVVVALYFVALHVTHLLLGRLDDLPVVYRRLPYGLAFFTTFSVAGILMMRVTHFIGLRTLFDLLGECRTCGIAHGDLDAGLGGIGRVDVVERVLHRGRGKDRDGLVLRGGG